MTARQATLALTALLLTAALAMGLALARLSDAARRDRAAAQTTSRIEHEVDRLISLRAARPTIGQGTEPQADALALVTAALADAALPSIHLQSLLPDAQASSVASIASGGYQHRTLRLTLGNLALPNLGAFLQSWRNTQSVWGITQISLRREPSTRSAQPDRWTVAMTLSATYLADPPPGATP